MAAHSEGVADLGTEWLPQCNVFLQHWRSLRHGALMPASEDFLDRPPPAYMPSCYIVDIEDRGAIVRFQGSELIRRWRADLSGLELHWSGPPAFKERSLSNMRNVVDPPCGHLSRLAYRTSIGRQTTSELILLPLAAKAGRPRRLICYAYAADLTQEEETVAGFLKTLRIAWLDIGAGVPDQPPFDCDG